MTNRKHKLIAQAVASAFALAYATGCTTIEVEHAKALATCEANVVHLTAEVARVNERLEADVLSNVDRVTRNKWGGVTHRSPYTWRELVEIEQREHAVCEAKLTAARTRVVTLEKSESTTTTTKTTKSEP